MPLALVLIGGVLILVAIRNSHTQLATLIREDMTGSGSFLVWLGAIAAIGAIGYVPGLKLPSRLLLGLVVLAVLLANQGVFANLAEAITNPPATQTASAEPKLPKALPVNLLGGGGGSTGSSVASAAKSAIPLIGGFL